MTQSLLIAERAYNFQFYWLMRWPKELSTHYLWWQVVGFKPFVEPQASQTNDMENYTCCYLAWHFALLGAVDGDELHAVEISNEENQI